MKSKPTTGRKTATVRSAKAREIAQRLCSIRLFHGQSEPGPDTERPAGLSQALDGLLVAGVDRDGRLEG